MSTTKILIAGIGGVGGYFGGKLAHFYEGNPSVEISFIARGEHLKKISGQGLEVITQNEHFVARPKNATDQASVIGKVNYLLLATKSYDLENMLQTVKENVDEHTVIIPLLNGVDHRKKIEQYFPYATIADACVYIVARKTAPGRIENSGNIQKFYFGVQDQNLPSLEILLAILQQAGIEAYCSMDIQSIIWEKFIFLSPIACVTSYYNRNIGEVLEQEDSKSDLIQLLDEIISTAPQNVMAGLSDIRDKTITKWQSLPYSSTSSMHSDYQAGNKKTEIESLCGEVLRALPKKENGSYCYQKMYDRLKLKN